MPASSRLLRPKGRLVKKKKVFRCNVITILDKVLFRCQGYRAKLLYSHPRMNFRETKSEVLSNIPDECFKKFTMKSLAYTVLSTVLTAFCEHLLYSSARNCVGLPVWLSYAAVTGTIATGCWVIAHECGHNAFSENRILGFRWIFFSLLLAFIFSWQRSARCSRGAQSFNRG